jgi:DNA-binding SARP family transcriptional activator
MLGGGRFRARVEGCGVWVELRLLGPIEVWSDGELVATGPPKQRCVLTVLALEANRVVPVETITDRVWDNSPAAAARTLVQTYVARLRRVLAECGASRTPTLTYRSGGYVLSIEPKSVDLHRFRWLFTRSVAIVHDDVERAISGMREALALWRGTPLSDLNGEWARRMRETLQDQRLAALRQLLGAQLDAGRHDEVLAQLDELLIAHPLDEKLAGQRMLALHRAGRHAESLDCYRDARASLLDEVGDEPGPELKDLHQRLLRRDPTLDMPTRRGHRYTDQPPRTIVALRAVDQRHHLAANRPETHEFVHRVLTSACAEVGLSWADCHRAEREGGVLVTAPPEVATWTLIDAVADHLGQAVDAHTNRHQGIDTVPLRIALHLEQAGEDGQQTAAEDIDMALRLLDAPALSPAPADSPVASALIISAGFLDAAARSGAVRDMTVYRSVEVVIDGNTVPCWVRLLHDSPTPIAPTPRQLPARPRLFTGRSVELARLTKALDALGDSGATVVISAIGGTGGMGKTWLALCWAHQNIGRFLDGQLYVNLRGFDPAGQPMPPEIAIRGFLDALGVQPGAIPIDWQAQIGLYRSLIADRRILVLLDNARDSAQVAPLLPGAGSCAVLVTSRHRLTGLATAHGAQQLDLDVLAEPEAAELLTRYLGHDVVAAEPEAVAEILACCAGLPLALSIVAARANAQPELPLAALAEELRDAADRLDTLDGGDLGVNLRAVFACSYHALGAKVARVFGLLGLAPGADTSLPATASLTGLPLSCARPVLRNLDSAYLVQQYQRGRYRMHDLVRLYAAERAHHDLPEDERTEALRRLIDFYLHTAYTGDRLLQPLRPPIQLGPPSPGCAPYPLVDENQAMTWFGNEHPNLLAAQGLSKELGWDTLVWQLAWALDSFHRRRGRLRDDHTTWQAALAAAERLADPSIQSLAHRRLGGAAARAGLHGQALDHLRQALAVAAHADDRSGQAHSHYAMARALEQQADDRSALTHAHHALRLSQLLGNPTMEAIALNAVGWYHARLGEYHQGRTYCELALTLNRHHGHRDGEADTLDSLGYIAHLAGRYTDALASYRQALALYRDVGNAYDEANTLARLAETHAALGNHSHAHKAWRHAQGLYYAQHRLTEARRAEEHLATLTASPHQK